MGQNAEVMPRPLNLSLVIRSLEVRTIFLPRNSVARLNDRARNDLKCVEGP